VIVDAGFQPSVGIFQTDGQKLSFSIADGDRYNLVEQNGKLINTYASKNAPPASANLQFTLMERKGVNYAGQMVGQVYFREDGQRLVALSIRDGSLFTCDTMSNQAFEIRRFQPSPLLPEIRMLPNDEVAVWSPVDASVTLINNAARKMSVLASPEVPAGAPTKYADFNVSSDHHYVAAGFRHSQFQLLDTKTGKTLLKFDWKLGSIHFAADSSRVLIVEQSGIGRWFKLPSGELDNEWKYVTQNNRGSSLRVEQASLVHGLLLCASDPRGGPGFPIILDAQTGQTKVALGRRQAVRTRLSSDGKFAVVLEPWSGDTPGSLVVYDVATGAEVGRTPTPRRTVNSELDISPQDKSVLIVVSEDPAGSRIIPDSLQRSGESVAVDATLIPKPEPYEKTRILGTANNPEFQDKAPEGGLLVGFEIGFGKFRNIEMIRSVRPIYRVGDKESKGEQHGTQLNSLVTLKAKKGYAVGAISAMHGLGFDGMSITFMKLVDGKLDPKDSYDSEYVGLAPVFSMRNTLSSSSRKTGLSITHLESCGASAASMIHEQCVSPTATPSGFSRTPQVRSSFRFASTSRKRKPPGWVRSLMAGRTRSMRPMAASTIGGCKSSVRATGTMPRCRSRSDTTRVKTSRSTTPWRTPSRSAIRISVRL
jgi:hypothetical protein